MKMNGNSIWTSKEVCDNENAIFKKEIALVERKCTPVLLVCKEHNEKWGVWVFINQTWLLVDPCGLVSTLYDDGESYIVLRDDNVKYSVTVIKTAYTFVWSVMCAEKSYYEVYYFRFLNYFLRIQNRINYLTDMVRDGHSIAYEHIKLEHLDICCKQLQIEALQPSHYRLMASQVVPEEFLFEPSNHSDRYRIGIGNRSYETFLTDWDNDYEEIRHQFESLIYSQDAKIALSFDSSDTIIQIKRVSILDEINEEEKGYGFKYKEFALVKIIPNDFVYSPIIAGYCDYKTTIKTLYEGLLSFALRLPLKNCNGNSNMDMYNRLKSPLIERYIKKNSIYDDNKPSKRQQHIRHVLLINPDFDALGIDLATGFDVTINHLGELDGNFIDKDGKPIVIPELAKWQQEIHPIVIASETKQPYKKDWEEYHSRGIELARKLGEQLSDDCDVWYSAPFEDKSGSICDNFLIL